jgi:hypothetical protein
VAPIEAPIKELKLSQFWAYQRKILARAFNRLLYSWARNLWLKAPGAVVLAYLGWITYDPTWWQKPLFALFAVLGGGLLLYLFQLAVSSALTDQEQMQAICRLSGELSERDVRRVLAQRRDLYKHASWVVRQWEDLEAAAGSGGTRLDLLWENLREAASTFDRQVNFAEAIAGHRYFGQVAEIQRRLVDKSNTAEAMGALRKPMARLNRTVAEERKLDLARLPQGTTQA